MLRIELPLPEKHPATLESSSFAVTRPQHVSLLFDLILPHRPFHSAYFTVSEVSHVSSKSSDEEKEMLLARVEWLPVTSHSHGQTSQTDKCKISIMMI